MSDYNSTKTVMEISAIDEDFIMESPMFVESAVLIPGAAGDYVELRDVVREQGTGNLDVTTAPAKTMLNSGDGEPRVMYFYNIMRLGFDYSDCVFTAGAKVIINFGG